ncbi:MAG: cytochrome c family protein, partial [Acidobacteriota bacterium]
MSSSPCLTLLLLALGLGAGPALGAGLELPPEHVVGPGDCGDCHEQEHEVWLATGHATGFGTLSRDEKARSIAAALGIRRVRRDPLCGSCHFTSAVVEETTKAIAGVACESCHGAGEEWIDIHWDLGEAADVESESAEHRKQRWASSEKAGMIRPSSPVDLIGRCYRCHVVDDQKLVDVGGHPQGARLDLVAATQGNIRHNFLRTGGLRNDEAPIERQRLYRLLGPWLELEATARALAAGPDEGAYRKGLLERVAANRSALKTLTSGVTLPSLDRALAALPA